MWECNVFTLHICNYTLFLLDLIQLVKGYPGFWELKSYFRVTSHHKVSLERFIEPGHKMAASEWEAKLCREGRFYKVSGSLCKQKWKSISLVGESLTTGLGNSVKPTSRVKQISGLLTFHLPNYQTCHLMIVNVFYHI